jgi:xanthine dehydrogenase accessory factor
MQLFFLNLLNKIKEGIPISCATILSKKGSTPQVPGASAVFNNQGLLSGTLGGGILEAEIQVRAIAALKEKKDLHVDYDLDGNIQDTTGAICGGYTSILIDSHPEDHIEVFKNLISSLKSNMSGVLISIFDPNPENNNIRRFWIVGNDDMENDKLLKYSISESDIAKAIQERSPVLKEDESSNRIIFYEPIFPDPHLVIVGAGHIGKALSHLGKRLDFRVTVIDDRPTHANKENIPDADEILSEDIEKDLQKISISENTYIVIVTQGHKKDAIALRNYIHSNAGYIGMIGSQRKTRLMKEDFVANGWATKEDLDTIYSPIGLDINSKTVQEIAISIAAQLVQKRQEKLAMKAGQDIEIIILAAGKSERMGQQKLLMPYAEKTMIEHIVEKAKGSNAGKVSVVVGSHQEEVTEIIQHLSAKVVLNRDFEKGMLSSVQCGFNAISSNSKAGMILLGDQPMVQTKVINKLIDSFYKTGKGIIIPIYKNKRGHPVIIDARYINTINDLNPQVGLRQLMIEHNDDIYEIEVDTNTILKDIDTIEDYKKELI